MKSFDVEEAMDEAQRLAIFGDPIESLRCLDNLLFNIGLIRWDVMELKGRVLELCGQYQKAVCCYREAVALEPDAVSPLISLSGCLYEMGRFSESAEASLLALTLLERGLGSDYPGDPVGCAVELAVSAHIAKSEGAEAQRAIHRGLRVDVYSSGVLASQDVLARFLDSSGS